MPTFPTPLYAVIGQPLFGNQWLALLAILGLITVFLFVVAWVGRWLAATHPEQVAITKKTHCVTSPETLLDTPPEVLAAIAAAVACTLGKQARVASVQLKPPGVSVEALMQQWSLEGRRQIYTSHKVR